MTQSLHLIADLLLNLIGLGFKMHLCIIGIMCDAGIICVIVDLGSMVADVMHPDLVSFQPCIDDFMDTVEAPALLRTV